MQVRWQSVGLMTAAVVVSAGVLIGEAAAQQGPGGAINPNRDCQTLLTCQYSKRGNYRGCVSSYSCRYCDFRTANCTISGGRRGVCRKLECRWG